MIDWQGIADAIGKTTGARAIAGPARPVAGGSINQAFRLNLGTESVFVKLNSAERLDMFEAEAEGLEAMANARAIRVPRPITTGLAGAHSFIAMQALRLGGPGDLQRAGAELAQLHRLTHKRFGWHRDNTIGSTPQDNAWADDWVSFLRDRRLGDQLRLAARNGYQGELQALGARLLADLDGFFIDYSPQASLLHGDLWAGNFAFDDSGRACIFDPASYYGDREADLAMTELFGGFGPQFRAGYEASWPLDTGYSRRKTLYNLYHILNHLNLFGSGYHGQAIAMLNELV